MSTYDDWKTDPDYDEESAKAFMRRMLGERRKDPDDDRLEREETL